MRKNIVYILLIIVCFSLQAHAATQPVTQPGEPDEDQVQVKAVRISYDPNNNFMVARGNVEMRQGDRIVTSDYLKVNLLTKDAYARGKVRIDEGGDILACEELKMNLEDRRGQVENAKVFIKKENFHISGKQIKSLGHDTYQVEKGIITTCDGDNPIWRIDAKKIDVTQEGYAKVQGSTFRVKGVPVMYFPYLLLPVKTERQSGFLFPEIGTSQRKGFEFNNSYFWTITPNTDATFYLDTASKKGTGEGIEYRFVKSKDTWGRLYSYYAYEDGYYFNNAYSNKLDRNPARGMVHFEGQHYISPDFYVKGFGTYITDREFYNDYGEEAKRTRYAWNRGSRLKALEKDESFLFANKNWDFYNLLVNFDVYKDLVQKNEKTLQRAPQVDFSSITQPLWNTPLYYQWNSSYDYFWREQGVKGNRLDVFPKISLPMNKDGWLTFNPEIGLRGMSYFGLNENNGYDKNGIFPDVHAELFVTFLRIFNIDKPLVQKLKHTIEPRLEYEYAPDFQQDDFPRFDLPDRFYKRHNITYSVTNRFTGLFIDNDGEPSEREFGYFKMGQTFNMRRPVGGLYLDGDPQDRSSDVFSELRLNIISKFYFKTKAGYNPNENNLSFYNALITWENLTGEDLGLEYRYERHRLEEWDVKGKLKIYEPVYFFMDSSYNLLDNEKLDNKLGIDYRAQCWGAKFWFESNSNTGGQKQNNGVKFTFYLRGMGDTRKEKQ